MLRDFKFPLSCTVSEIISLVCELTAFVTTNDFDKYAYFCSNAAEVVAQTIVVSSFV